MRRVQRASEGIPMRSDLVEAGLEMGFALLQLAQSQTNGEARRVLREARAACLESENRAARLNEADARRFRARCADLYQAIDRVASRSAKARTIRMPPR